MAVKDNYYTISEAAKAIGVARQTVSHWINDGKIPAEKVGRAMLIDKQKLHQYNNERLNEEKRRSVEGQLIGFIREKYNYTDEDEILFTGLDFSDLFRDIFGVGNTKSVKTRIFAMNYGFLVTLKNGQREKISIQLGEPESLVRKKGEPFVILGIKEPIESIMKEPVIQ
jgi:excisionase family DNA binding protein